MGALHRGHISLMKLASAQNDFVVATIFVNPTQFAPTEDLDRYPRTLEKDIDLMTTEQAGVNFVFAPSSPKEMYPAGCVTRVEIPTMQSTHEGQSRPGFFSGVATVVSKLFNIVRPTRAYFGQKDAMQCIAIKRMVRDLNFPIDVIIGETMREPDGLAMSSRNIYLSPDERKRAPLLYKALSKGKQLYLGGERDAQKITAAALQVLDEAKHQPPVMTPQYLSLADASFGHEVKNIEEESEGAILSAAVFLGSTRLIDNVVLPPPKQIRQNHVGQL